MVYFGVTEAHWLKKDKNIYRCSEESLNVCIPKYQHSLCLICGIRAIFILTSIFWKMKVHIGDTLFYNQI